MSDNGPSPIETLDDLLNSIQTLPLDTQHHTKQILINEKIHKKLNTKYLKLQKKYLKNNDCTLKKRLKRIEKKIKKAIQTKLESAITMQNILLDIQNKMKEKMEYLKDDINFNLPDIGNMPTIVRTGNPMENDDENTLYCICSEKSHGDMICCDDNECKIGWYHFKCVGLLSTPKGEWFCESCRRKRRLKKM